jgi:DNA repair protein RadC
MQSHIFLFETEQYSTKPGSTLTVSERLERYGADALTVEEHLALLVGCEILAAKLLKHFG